MIHYMNIQSTLKKEERTLNSYNLNPVLYFVLKYNSYFKNSIKNIWDITNDLNLGPKVIIKSN